jgi:hypothetical protein
MIVGNLVAYCLRCVEDKPSVPYTIPPQEMLAYDC